MTEAMPAFVSDLLSAALFESWRAAAVAVVLAVGSCATGLLVIPNTVARPAIRALAGFPVFLIGSGGLGIVLYLLGLPVSGGLTAAFLWTLICSVVATRRGEFRSLGRLRELTILAVLLLFGFLFAFFGWGETADGTIRALPGAWGDGPLHVLIAEAFARRSGPDLSMPAFAGETLREPFGYDFVAAMLRQAGFTVGGAFTLPAGALLASLLGWVGHLASRLVEMGNEKRGVRTGDRLASFLISCFLLLTFGGAQWVVMARHDEAWSPAKFFGFHQPSWDKVEDLDLVWANHLNTFLSQKHLLLASAFLLVLVAVLYEFAVRPPASPPLLVKGPAGAAGGSLPRQDPRVLLPFAIATGLLPFFHLHAFIVAGLVWAVALLLRRSAVIFNLGVFALLISLPFVLWTSRLFGREGFLSLTPGWMASGIGRWLWFWVVNLGVYVAVLAFALIGAWRRDRRLVMFFGLPAAVVFLTANLVQFQPYLWDNFKFFLLAWLLLLPLVAAEIGRWRFAGARAAAVAVVLLMSFTTLANLPTYFQFRSQYPAYTPAQRQTASVLEQRIPARRTVTFSDADTVHNHPLTLTGRTLYAGYGGWIWTRRYAWEDRVGLMQRLRTSPPDQFCALARQERITHVVDSAGKDTAVDSVCP